MTSRDDPRVARSRAAALSAAREILRRDGWAGVTHAAVAAHSGVGRTTLYRHWSDVPSLLRDVIAERLVITHSEPAGVLRDDLVRELDALSALLDDPDAGYAVRVVLERAAVDSAYDELRERFYREAARVHVEIVRAAIERGDLAPVPDPRAAVDRLVGPLMYRRLVGGRPFTAADVRRVVGEFVETREAKP
jgi:AcrR family transcriptional regulator